VIDGHDGVLVHYEGAGPADEYGAIWLDGKYSLELRGPADSEADFRALVASVKSVDEATWLAALPKSAVLPDERAAVVAEMRVGVPTPPRFDESSLEASGVADRYQLGALVAGQLACGWFDEWLQADKTGDVVRKAQAASVLASSKSWPVLIDMVDEGDYAEMLWQYADQVAADGKSRYDGDPGIRGGNYVSGLGCNRQ
jgi:hypothetical protein